MTAQISLLNALVADLKRKLTGRIKIIKVSTCGNMPHYVQDAFKGLELSCTPHIESVDVSHVLTGRPATVLGVRVLHTEVMEKIIPHLEAVAWLKARGLPKSGGDFFVFEPKDFEILDGKVTTKES